MFYNFYKIFEKEWHKKYFNSFSKLIYVILYIKIGFKLIKKKNIKSN